MIKTPNPNQEPPAYSHAANIDLNDIDIFCTFKINSKDQNLNHESIKVQKQYKIIIKIPNPSQELSVSYKALK